MSGQDFEDLDDVASATHSNGKVKYLTSDVKKNLRGKRTFALKDLVVSKVAKDLNQTILIRVFKSKGGKKSARLSECPNDPGSELTRSSCNFVYFPLTLFYHALNFKNE